MRDTNLQVNEKRLIHSSLMMYLAFIFSEYSAVTSSKQAFIKGNLNPKITLTVKKLISRILVQQCPLHCFANQIRN